MTGDHEVMTTSHASHPDRLLPADPGTRDIARRLLAHVEDLPIISPHGHLEASMFVKDEAFPDPTSLLISPDHYLTRMMHSAGVDLADLRVGGHEGKSAREAWRIFMSHWDLYAGTATGYWVEQEFEHVFGINAERLNVGTPEHADAIFDELTDILAKPDFRPRALAEQFNLEVLATTDDPLDDLADHKALADDPTFSPRVLPTFRPDAYTKMYNAGWAEKTTKLIDTAGDGKAGWEGYLQAMRNRRQYFINHGATSADHGLHDTDTTPLSHEDAQKILDKGLAGTATLAEMRAFEANTTYRFAEMSQEDGLVMTIHPGVYRNHSASAQKKFGADIGADIPFQMEFTNGLRPLLSDFGENKDLISDSSFNRWLRTVSLRSTQDADMAAASNLAANSKMAHQNTRDILDAVSDGGVMLGRNGALVLGPVVGTLHIKFIAPLNKRVERVMYKTGLSEAAAAEQYALEDRLREEMAHALYQWNPGRDENYDLVINTGSMTYERIVDLVVETYARKYPLHVRIIPNGKDQ